MAKQVKEVSFTHREEEVLQALTEFPTNSEMSEKLHITYETVRSHLKNLKRKIGVKHKIHLIKYAVEHEYGAKQSPRITEGLNPSMVTNTQKTEVGHTVAEF